MVSTDGGRYDACVRRRVRRPIYWDAPDSRIRRCSWFHRDDGDTKFVPYEEDFADKLEVNINTHIMPISSTIVVVMALMYISIYWV